MIIKAKLLHERASLPCRATPGSAGYDIAYAGDESVTLHPGSILPIPTGVCLEAPSGICYLVCSRSGLAFQENLVVFNAPGIIDSDYRGEIKVLVHNAGKDIQTILPGTRIAQLLFMKHESVGILPVTELNETQRGQGGFGSTGIGELK